MQPRAASTAALNIVIGRGHAVVRQFLKDTVEHSAITSPAKPRRGPTWANGLAVEPDVVLVFAFICGSQGLDALRQSTKSASSPPWHHGGSRPGLGSPRSGRARLGLSC